MTEQVSDFAFLPLGGTGEIGMNFNLYRMRENGVNIGWRLIAALGFRVMIRRRLMSLLQTLFLLQSVRRICAVW